jgi:hypothetical protein
MNKLVLSALAATVAVGTTNASESDWAGLDAELSTLTTAFTQDGGPSISGYVEATYDSNGDTWSAGNGGTDRQRLSVSGSSGGFGYHVTVLGNEDDDAYVTFDMFGMSWTMGDFRAPGTANDAADQGNMTFTTRDFGNTGARSHGLMTSGDAGGVGYQVHFGNDMDLSARLTFDVMSGDGMNLSLAYSTADVAGVETSNVEADISSGPFAVHVTMGDGGTTAGGDSQTCITASYAVNDTWGIALRQTDNDTGADETMDWAITNDAGGARWTIQSLDEGDVTLGCIVGF